MFATRSSRVVLPRPLFDEARAQAEASSTRLSAPAQVHGGAAARAPTRTGARFAARSPTGATSRRSARTHTTLALARAGAAVAARRHGCARCSTTGTMRSAIRRRSPRSWTLAARLRRRARRDGDDLDAADGRRGDRAQGHARRDRLHAHSARRRPARRRRVRSSRTTRRRSGFALGVFKAAQLLEMDDVGAAFATSRRSISRRPTTTSKTAEIVEIAAVRVRDGQIVERFHSLVKPRVADRRRRRRRRTAFTRADVATAPHVRGDLAEVPRVLRRRRHRRAQRLRVRLPDPRAHGRRRSARSSISAPTTRCRSRAISIRRAASSWTSRGSSASTRANRIARSTTRWRSRRSSSRSTP